MPRRQTREEEYEQLLEHIYDVARKMRALVIDEGMDEYKVAELHWISFVYNEELTASLRHLCQLMPYEKYLRTPHWHDVRTEAVRRAAYRCQLCNAGGPLHVHHRSYAHLGWEDEHMEDLIALCPACHAKHHDRGTKKPGAQP